MQMNLLCVTSSAVPETALSPSLVGKHLVSVRSSAKPPLPLWSLRGEGVAHSLFLGHTSGITGAGDQSLDGLSENLGDHSPAPLSPTAVTCLALANEIRAPLRCVTSTCTASHNLCFLLIAAMATRSESPHILKRDPAVVF